jgi:hypothetical protein
MKKYLVVLGLIAALGLVACGGSLPPSASSLRDKLQASHYKGNCNPFDCAPECEHEGPFTNDPACKRALALYDRKQHPPGPPNPVRKAFKDLGQRLSEGWKHLAWCEDHSKPHHPLPPQCRNEWIPDYARSG